MVDSNTMPEGLTNKDIPISNKIDELVNSNLEVNNSLDSLINNTDRDFKSMSNIFKKLNDNKVPDVNSLLEKINNPTNTFKESSTSNYSTVVNNISNKEVQADNFVEPLTSILPSKSLEEINSSVKEINNSVVDIFALLSGLEPPKEPKNEDPSQPSEPKEDPRQQNKFLDGLKEEFDKLTGKLSEGTSNLYDNIMPTMLGGFNLITQPLQQLTGFNLLDSLKGGFKGIFGKKSSKNPSSEDVAKGGFMGAGFLYLSKVIKDTLGKGGSEDGGGGLLDKLGLNLPGGAIASGFMKGLGVVGLAGFVGLKIKDAIEGSKLAEEWGVSTQAGIVGAILGGTEEGLMNAVKVGLTGALGGASLGLIVGGPVGAIVGGIAGLIIAGIAGYFGGEKFAKIVQGGMDVVDFEARQQAGQLTNQDLITVQEEKIQKENEELIKLREKGAKRNKIDDKAVEIQQLNRDLEMLKREADKFGADNISNYQKADKGFFGNIWNTIKGETEYEKVDASLNDGIIYANGKIVHTHEDDNIIATKNDPRQISMQSRDVAKTPNFEETTNTGVNSNEVVDLLSELVTLFKDKTMGNTTVIQSGSNNFEGLRNLGVAQ